MLQIILIIATAEPQKELFHNIQAIHYIFLSHHICENAHLK